jgi:hypothetical protein
MRQSRREAHRSTSGHGLSSAIALKRARESSGMRGKGAGVSRGGAHPFIGIGER